MSTPRQKLFKNAMLRSTISGPVLAIALRDRDARFGSPFDMEALIGSPVAAQAA